MSCSTITSMLETLTFAIRTCLALLQGHTALVCQVQLSNNVLISGGSDGRVIVFSMLPNSYPQPLSAAPSISPSSSSSPYDSATTSTSSLADLSPFHPHHPAQRQLRQLRPQMSDVRGNSRSPTVPPKQFSVVQRLTPHDSSVTGLQFDMRFLVTSGNDGRVRLFEFHNADGGPGTATDGLAHGGKFEYVRELSDTCESVWKVAYTEHTCAIMYKRANKTWVEIWSFKPSLSDLKG